MWISTLIAFSVYQMAPGGPLQFLDDDPTSSKEDVNRLERHYGLDRSIPVQYTAWLLGEDWMPSSDRFQSGQCMSNPDRCSRGIVRLDFGRSFHFKGQPVIDLIVERIPATFLLAFSSLLISVLIGVPLGIISALNRGRWADNSIRLTTVLINTVPEWWIGLVLLIVLGAYLGLVPLGGMYTIGDGSLSDRLHHLILPATVAAISGWIGFSRILRFEMLDVLNQDYVRTARAKGLSRNAVIIHHVLRNAMMPFITGLSGIFLLILSGSVLFEIVFSWPGMGRLAITAINARDYPVMMALFVISAFLGIMGVLMVDILYGIADPRVKYNRTAV
ncbi:MAG: ABC transporter permease [Caldilineaceae bacterium]|nr:ABC transporter permease [Caldilineaceae bacterium]